MKKQKQKTPANPQGLTRRSMIGSIGFLSIFISTPPALAKRRGRKRRRGRRGGRADDDHAKAWKARRSGEILGLAGIIASVHKVRPGEVIDVRLREIGGRLVYVLVILTRTGGLLKIQVNALSGVILRMEEQ